MSRFATTNSWDTNAGLTRRNRILWNKLKESKPVSDLGARERIEELYKRIPYVLIYCDLHWIWLETIAATNYVMFQFATTDS